MHCVSTRLLWTGDYGLGYCSNSLELGCDCLGAICYFDALLANSKGVLTCICHWPCGILQLQGLSVA